MATKPQKVKKIVLAYSGGLDTSVILPWLKDKYGCKVIAFAADLGQGADELDGIKQKARASGASKCIVADLRKQFAENHCFKLLAASALYEGVYMLGTAIARPLIAKAQVDCAKAEGADAVAHGCTGKGNDQVRFELTYMALAPKLKIISPWKDPSFELTSRQAAVRYAKKHGIPVAQTKKKIYSRDRNLWHISHEGGDLENLTNEPASSLWMMSVPLSAAPNKPGYVQIDFKSGVPVALDGVRLSGHELMARLNALGGKHAIGQVDLVENRLVGIKCREVYETPGGTILFEAHRALESVTLDRETLHYKQQVALKYAEMVYYGQWYCPLREALDAFIAKTQQKVTGSVRIKCFKGRAATAAIDSPNSLYCPALASFTMGDEYTPSDATGFIRLFGLQMKGRGDPRR